VRKRILSVALVLGVAAIASVVIAAGIGSFRAGLIGEDEVPSVSTGASASFEAQGSPDGNSFSYKLSYSSLEGTVTQAHIHFGDRDVNGGISVWLCSNLTSPPTPPGVQACPAPPATITGTVSAADVVGPAAQGIDTGQFSELVRQIENGLTYANVHSTRFPGGEVRGQIKTFSPSSH
jgi:hypothetical protein